MYHLESLRHFQGHIRYSLLSAFCTLSAECMFTSLSSFFSLYFHCTSHGAWAHRSHTRTIFQRLLTWSLISNNNNINHMETETKTQNQSMSPEWDLPLFYSFCRTHVPQSAWISWFKTFRFTKFKPNFPVDISF